MEYTKTIWKDLPDTSTPITADRLQNIEDGIEYLFKHGVGGGDTLPIGIILPFSDNTIPEGYLLCDGSAISRTTYADLFSVIGTTYGEGDGTTTFNLPNLKGRVPIGKDEADTDFDVLGETGGEKTHTLTVNEMPSHIHSMNSVINGTNVQDSTPVRMQTDKYSWGGTSSYWTDNAGENQPHNNLQPYQVVNYIIKVIQTVSMYAQEVDTKKPLKKLWENENTEQTFPEQDITLSTSDYDYLIWIYRFHVDPNNNVQKSQLVLNGAGVIMDVAWDYGVGGSYTVADYHRRVQYTNNTSYFIEDCNIKYNNTQDVKDNNYIIPVAVYGGKF